ncbi:ferrous iron transport protein B [Oxobacter pfennigii]|uniref:Ferrous iron transport protein B n=1 Tax=Oxobacter pfennigii TaxID=36849 RepID=A0A0P8Y7E2_9CLOT|nr:ferrous iron transport protein B [Oxobacter pfennigii]
MGLTRQSGTKEGMADVFNVEKLNGNEAVIALAGNPNTGKSTVFNALTGLHQHTGNWPGKTVTNARGNYRHRDCDFILIDLPGTYSLLASSIEEQVARDFICFGNPDATIVVTDATNLERNLNLVLQVMELTDNVIMCVNLMDEAKRKNIEVDASGLSIELGIPVVTAAAREGTGLCELMDCVYDVAAGKLKPHPKRMKYEEDIEGALKNIMPRLSEYIEDEIKARWIALRLLDGDKTIIDSIKEYMLGTGEILL